MSQSEFIEQGSFISPASQNARDKQNARVQKAISNVELIPSTLDIEAGR